MINTLFIRSATHTDKYIYSPLELQSSISNRSCNHPSSGVEGGKATLNWELGEQMLVFVLYSVWLQAGHVTSVSCLPFCWLWHALKQGCLLPCESANPLVCFPADVSSWSWKRCLRAPSWCFCCAKCPSGKWEGWMGQAGGSNHNGPVQVPGVKISLMPGKSWALCNLMASRELCDTSLLLHLVHW